MRTIAIVTMAVMLSACGHNQNVIETANTYKVLGSLTKAGVTEEVIYCVKDIFDPGNRGSGC